MKQRFNLKSWVPFPGERFGVSKCQLTPHRTVKIVSEKSNFDGFYLETWGVTSTGSYRTFTVNHVQNPVRMIAKWTGKRLSKKSR